MPGQVDHHTVSKRLPIGASTSTSRREHHCTVLSITDQPRQNLHILRVQWKQSSLGQTLVNRIVGS